MGEMLQMGPRLACWGKIPELQENVPLLLPSPQASSLHGGLRARTVSPVCLHAAVFGLTTRLDHATVHAVIQHWEEFPRMP